VRFVESSWALAAVLGFVSLAAAACDSGRCRGDCIVYYPSGPDAGTSTTTADAGASRDGGAAGDAGSPRDGGAARDAGPSRDGGDANDCRVTACGTNERCNTTTFVCECVADALACGAGCSLCPTDPGVVATGCASDRCVATACGTGYTQCGDTCCESVPVWQTTIVETSAGGASSVIVDAQGHPAVAFSSDSPRGVYFAAHDGTRWGATEPVDTRTNALYPRLVGTSVPIVVNSVLDVSAERVASWSKNGTWSPLGTIDDAVFPDVAVGGGYEHLVSRTAGFPSDVRYHRRIVGASSWGAATPVAVDVTFAARIAASTTGGVVVLYVQDDDLFAARRATLSSAWTTDLIATGPVWELDVAVDTSGVEHLTYYVASTHFIRYETYIGRTRTRGVTVETSQNMAPGSQHFSGLAIAVGNNGAHLSYLDFSRGGSLLRYAADVDGFVPETIANADDILGDTSIAVDANGAPHVTYPAPSSSWPHLGYAVKR
jgi:hypothetical protein